MGQIFPLSVGTKEIKLQRKVAEGVTMELVDLAEGDPILELLTEIRDSLKQAVELLEEMAD